MGTNKLTLKVGIIYPGPFPWNRGVGQLYDALRIMGHNPAVMCVAPEKRYLNEEPGRFNVIHMRNSETNLMRIKAAPLSLNYFWKLFIRDSAKRHNFDCFFVRETNFLWQSFSVAKELNIPCFVDMRENLGLMYSLAVSSRFIKLFQNKTLISYIEAKFLGRTSHIFTVSRELKEWVTNRYRIGVGKISVLGNYPDSDFITKANIAQSKRVRKTESPVQLVFAGNVSPIKGVQDIIRSLPIVLQAHRCTFTIIGSGKYVEKLKGIACDLGISEHIIFRDLVRPETLAEELSQYDIGICPYLVNEFTDQTMPGKLFEYMAVGLPIFSSARKPVARIIEEEQCGVIYNSRDVNEIATKLIYLIENSEDAMEMGVKGRKAVLSKYNSQSSVKTLEDVLTAYFR